VSDVWGVGNLDQKWTAPRLLWAAVVVPLMFSSGLAVAQDGSFFSNDVFIEEDVMIEGAFDSGFVTETYDESIEAADDDLDDDASDSEAPEQE